MIKRRKTRSIKVGNKFIGGNNPVLVQSMAKTDTSDVARTISQIKELESSGCELVRVAVLDMKAAKILGKIKEKIKVPLAADIHFDYKLALEAINQGVDKLRLNPGNITDSGKIKEIVKSAARGNIPIRIGVNSGSVSPAALNKCSGNMTKAMVASASSEINLLEELGFDKIIISLKSSDVLETIEAYKLLSKKCDYPFHIGITEAGTLLCGSIKSAAGLAILLYEGIGDTIRVSLTADPVEEVRAAYGILRALGLGKRGVQVISCPTCGRCKVNIFALSKKIESVFSKINKPLKIAVMGCVVNGPGEAKAADVGVAFGKKDAVLFLKGRIIKKISEKEVVSALKKEVEKLAYEDV